MSLCLLLLPLFFVQLLFTVLFHALHHLIQRQFARVFLDLFNLWFDLFLSLRWLLLCCRQRHLLVGLMGVLCTWNKILRHRHDDRTTRDNSARWNLWLRLLGHVCLRLLRLRLIIGYILFFLLCYWSWRRHFIDTCIPFFILHYFFLFNLYKIVDRFAYLTDWHCSYFLRTLCLFIDPEFGSQGIFLSPFIGGGWILNTSEVSKIVLILDGFCIILFRLFEIIWVCRVFNWSHSRYLSLILASSLFRLYLHCLFGEKSCLLLRVFVLTEVHSIPLWVIDITHSRNRHINWSYFVKLSQGHLLWFSLEALLFSHFLINFQTINLYFSKQTSNITIN